MPLILCLYHIIWYLSFSIWLTSLSITISSCILVAVNGMILFFLLLSNIPFIYVPHLLYPFTCQWTFTLFPCLGSIQYSAWKIPGAWWAAVHGVAKSETRLSDLTFTFHFHALEKEMATHSSVLAWRILGMGVWWAADYGVSQSQTRLKRLSSSSMSWLLWIVLLWM